MPITHAFQSGRGDNSDAGAIQPSQWNANHALTGMLAALDAVAPSPSTVLTFDGTATFQLLPFASFAPVYSPAFSGVPTAPTAASNSNGAQIATTAFVTNAITTLIGGAPGALSTLNELAAAINDNTSYAATVTAVLGVRLRVDAAQGLSTGQQAQGQINLGLATVAASGSYSDLSNKPNINIELAAAIDLNTVIAPGTYYTRDSASVNAPSASYLTLRVETGTSSCLTQWATISNSTVTYIRECNYAGVWSAWQQLVALDTLGRLPAVDGSQLTGIPTASGAVVFNASQSLTNAEQSQARQNIGMTDGQLPATTTDDSAAAGKLGECLSNSATVSSMSSGVAFDFCSITLTPGDWDVSAMVELAGDPWTVQEAVASISATSAALDGTIGKQNAFVGPFVQYFSIGLPIPPYRFSVVAGTTLTLYLVGFVTWNAGSGSMAGRIQARRMR